MPKATEGGASNAWAWTCADCGSAWAPGAPACPECRSTAPVVPDAAPEEAPVEAAAPVDEVEGGEPEVAAEPPPAPAAPLPPPRVPPRLSA